MESRDLKKGNEYFYQSDHKFVKFLRMEGGKAIVEDSLGDQWAVYPEQLEETEQE